MKLLVLGGGGFIGSAIVDRLLLDGHDIRVFERPRVNPFRKFENGESVEWLTGDLLSHHDVTEAIDGTDAVVHLVSTTLPKSSNDDPVYDVQTNVVATLQLLNAMVQKNVRRIIFISSGGTVYGTPQYLPIDESHPTNPHVSYGITKLTIEKYLLMYQRIHGIRTSILRVANPFGERQRVETAQGAVGVFLSRALRGENIEIWGDGTITRDYLHISDVADAFSRSVVYQGGESVFNVSSGIGTTLNDLIETIESVTGRSIQRTYLPGRPYDVQSSVLDNSLAQSELGWKVSVSMREGLERTARWMRSMLGQ